MMARRSFIAGILGAAVAPAIVRAESLMKVAPLVVPSTEGWVSLDDVDRLGYAGPRVFTCELGQIDFFTIHKQPLTGTEMLDLQAGWGRGVVDLHQQAQREFNAWMQRRADEIAFTTLTSSWLPDLLGRPR